jgi:hypothetical protein
MNQVDISVLATAHSETLVAGPPIRSAECAIDQAERQGWKVERILGMDSPSEECREYLSQPTLDRWNRVEVDFSDPYRTRNALAALSTGRWLAFLDVDDLFGDNWLVAAASSLRAAEQQNERVIAHPEINWVFDEIPSVFTKPSQDDPLFTPYYWYFLNYYDMMCMAPRDAHLEIPYAARDLKGGFGYGDWQWNIETMAAGWKHISVRDTIIFKRRREGSVSRQNAIRRTVIYDVEAMAIDRIESLGRR